MAAAVAWVFSGVSVSLFVPGTFARVWPWVVAIMLVIGGALLVTYVRSMTRWVPYAAATANVAAGFVGLRLVVGSLGEAEAAATMSIVVFFAFTIFRLQPALALAAVAPYMAAHQIVLVTHHRDGRLADAAFGLATVIPLTAVVIGLIVAWILERSGRDAFRDETIIEQQREQIAGERDRAETLLLNILPAPIAERLKENADIIADRFDEVTVLFADVVGFTPMSARVPPEETVTLLDRVFSAFDALAEKYGVEKIKTIGDAYMAVAGLPEPSPDHAETMADFALAVRDAAFDLGVTMRIGLATGPVVAGVIGTHKFAYDLWGDTVNTASRMESHGIPGEIQVPEATYRVLDADYVLVERGQLTVKGKGDMTTWLLKGRR